MSEARLLLGVIGRPHGVRGHVHVTSYTDQPADLFSYGPLSDEGGRVFVLRAHGEGVAEILSVAGAPVRDRDAAARLTNARLYVDRAALPPPDDDEFYFSDLVGLAAVDEAGTTLGSVVAVHDYGGGATIELSPGGAMVAFTRASVPVVDLAVGRIVVSLPAEVEVAEAAE